MKANLNTDKVIILFYPQFAGGKFLMNCLALSKNATFQNSEIARKDLELKDYKIDENFHYNFKLDAALKSLPPNKKECINWKNYEYGCIQFFNWNCSSSDYFDMENDCKDEIKILSNRTDTNFFIVSHTTTGLQKILNYFKNAKIIMLTEFNHFLIKSANLKSNKSFDKGEYHIARWEKQFDTINKKFNIDYIMSYKNIFNEDNFLDDLKNLYDELGYEDYNKELIRKFYRAYISLHY